MEGGKRRVNVSVYFSPEDYETFSRFLADTKVGRSAFLREVAVHVGKAWARAERNVVIVVSADPDPKDLAPLFTAKNFYFRVFGKESREKQI